MKQRTEAQIIEEIQHEGEALHVSLVCEEVEAGRQVIYAEHYAGNFCFTRKGGQWVTSRAEFERWKAARWYREVKSRPKNHVKNYEALILKLNKDGKGPLSIAVRVGVDARDVVDLLVKHKRIRAGLYAHRDDWEQVEENAEFDF